MTEENLQSRLRGVTLMAMSNKWGALVLTTGNKSELAVGYCTSLWRYVRRLGCDQRRAQNAWSMRCRASPIRGTPAPFPENVFAKPPSAELRPDQKDTDSLPAYDVLDQILRCYIESNESPQQIADALHLPVTLVRDIVNKVDRNEYKRQQAAPD